MESEGAGFGASQSVSSKISFHMVFLGFLIILCLFGIFQTAITAVFEWLLLPFVCMRLWFLVLPKTSLLPNFVKQIG
jgi:hypothetical protein